MFASVLTQPVYMLFHAEAACRYTCNTTALVVQHAFSFSVLCNTMLNCNSDPVLCWSAVSAVKLQHTLPACRHSPQHYTTVSVHQVPARSAFPTKGVDWNSCDHKCVRHTLIYCTHVRHNHHKCVRHTVYTPVKHKPAQLCQRYSVHTCHKPPQVCQTYRVHTCQTQTKSMLDSVHICQTQTSTSVLKQNVSTLVKHRCVCTM